MSTFRVAGVLSLDGSRFTAGLSRAETAASRFASSVSRSIGGKLAGLFAVGALTAFAKKTIEVADGLTIAAKRMGTTVEEVQILKAAGKDVGVELDKITVAFGRITAARGKALGAGGEKFMQGFAAAGITPDMVKNMGGSGLALGPMAQYAKSVSRDQAIVTFEKILGRGAGPIVDVLRSDLEEVGNQLRSFGGLMSGETAYQLKMFKDQLEIAEQVVSAVWATGMIKAFDSITAGLSKFLGWLDSRMKPPAEEDKNVLGASPSSAWGLSGKAGAVIMGGVNGLLGLADEVYGDKAKAEDRLIDAMRWFEIGGIKGGWMEDAADAMVKRQNEGKGGLKSAFDDVVEGIKAEARRRANAKPETGGIEPLSPAAEKIAGRKNFGKIDSDSLVAVGNFLGAGTGASMQRIAVQQLDVQRQMLSKLTQIADEDSFDEGFGGND